MTVKLQLVETPVLDLTHADRGPEFGSGTNNRVGQQVPVPNDRRKAISVENVVDLRASGRHGWRGFRSPPNILSFGPPPASKQGPETELLIAVR